MKHPNYTIEQAEFVQYIKNKVEALFDDVTVPAHGYDHVSRVAQWTREIAMEEAPDHVFMAELAGWLYNIGRVPEYQYNPEGKRYHELSYDLLKTWIQKDIEFYKLKDHQKLELLYAVRYQSNEYADKYTSANVLRDAIKMDLFGTQGLERILAWCEYADVPIDQHVRLVYTALYHLQSSYANNIVIQQSLMTPIDEYLASLFHSQIEPVTIH